MALQLSRALRWLRPLRSADINPAKHGPVRRFFALLGSFWDVLAYTYLAVLTVAVVSRAIGSAPAVLQPVHAVLPMLFLPLVFVVPMALIRRRGILIVLSLLFAMIGWFSVSPARGKAITPAWVAEAKQSQRTVSIAYANAYYKNLTMNDAATNLLRQGADVVVVVELTDEHLAALEAAGFAETYPHRSLTPKAGVTGAGVFSKFPIVESRRWGADKLPDVDIALTDAVMVRVVAMHPLPPIDGPTAPIWKRQLDGLRKRALKETEFPFAAVGDFNGSRWQPSFGQLLRPLDDVHEQLGMGLSASWPVDHPVLPPSVRLDHALVNPLFFPLSMKDVAIPGSDHRGFVTTLAIKQPPPDVPS